MDDPTIQETLQDPEFQQRVLNQFLDLYVIPEIIKRQEAGRLERPIALTAAQIVFSPDGRRAEVRINSEVQVLAQPILRSGVAKDVGDVVFPHEIEGFERFWLTDKDDPDCGHATLLNVQGVWFIGFDLRRNKDFARRHLATAQQFYEAAEFSWSRRNWSSLIDNLFSAAELAAKAELVQVFWNLRESRKHTAVHDQYNRFARLGNVPCEFREVFNKLTKLRNRARYLEAEMSLTDKEAESMLAVVKAMIESTLSNIGPLPPVADKPHQS